MSEIAAVVSDPAEMRAFECLLPGDARVSLVAARLAELMRFPVCGAEGEPLDYGFVAKGGSVLDGDAILGETDLAEPLALRLVPELVIGADPAAPAESEGEAGQPSPDAQEIVIGAERALLHDPGLDLPLDLRMDAAVHHQIEQFASRDRYAECAGLLLGRVELERRHRVIQVTAIAPAAGAVESRTSVRVTLGAWESMLAVRDRQYAQLRVLGWFHTHAGWGVFMSDSDVFAHRSFFPHPNMAAYVLDPTSGHEGFFCWKNGEIALCPSYALVGAPSEQVFRRRGRRRKRAAFLACAMAAGAAVGLYTGIARSPRVHKPPAHRAIVKTSPAPIADRPDTRDRLYVLGKRENLWIVCNRVYRDGDLAPALATYNGIKSYVHLQVGQQIKLPPEEVLRRMRRGATGP